jgi:hypothetical protein
MIEAIFSHSFALWKKNLKHVVIFSIVSAMFYFLLSFLLAKYFGIIDKVLSIQGQPLKQIVVQIDLHIKGLGWQYLLVTQLIVAMCVWPLKAGFVHLLHKHEQGQRPSTQDLFFAYQGENIGKFLPYFIGFALLNIVLTAVPLLSVALVLMQILYGLLVVPVMVVENQSTGQSISKAMYLNSQNRISMVVLAFLGWLLSYAGIVVFVFGMLFSWPFLTIICYSAYVVLSQPKTP